MTEELSHYGTPRHSGRYPWGSGKDPFQSADTLSAAISTMRAGGMSETEIAGALGLSTTEYRARKSIASAEIRAAKEAQALRLKDAGMSNRAIGREMGINESSVRSLLNPSLSTRANKSIQLADKLADEIGKDGIIDIGKGVDQYVGGSQTQLNNSVAVLKEKGYKVYYVKVKQATTDHETTLKVLAPPGMTYGDVMKNREKIKVPGVRIEDHGSTLLNIKPPVSLSSKRVAVRAGDEGGAEMDGVIQIRRGAKDLNLGNASYAQVRIAVDGTHYLKGMAMYSDKMPPGVDVVFNTNKPKKSLKSKLDAMKPMKDDPDNPFGATIRRQNFFTDSKGKSKQGVVNIVNEEGDWADWGKNLSTQFLGKQPLSLIKAQVKKSADKKREDFEKIMSLTNPVVRKKLLQSYADDVDAAAVHLKVASLPRQAAHVILPFPKMNPKEVYAPNYKNGERVVLVRYPHAGRFELAELTVNNKYAAAKKILGSRTKDAIGIHHSVAEKLSGADFDGDTVMVIPNNDGKIKTAKALRGLKGFDPKISYPQYKGMQTMKKSSVQQEMGTVSNLITDMTLKGASTAEITRAVRHSMVVIDAHKHKLNYKQSEIDHGIPALKKKYQGRSGGSASTLLSRVSGPAWINDRKPRPAAQGGPFDKKTGKRVYVETGKKSLKKDTDPKTGKTIWVEGGPKKIKVKRGTLYDDLHKLSSGSIVETVYADYGNGLKALANLARKEMVATSVAKRDPSARKAYAKEVESLSEKLKTARRNAPRERQAQLLANTTVRRKIAGNPDIEESDHKRLKRQALAEARVRTGTRSYQIDITPSEWKAIQSNAVSSSMLSEILDHADLKTVQDYAMPQSRKTMSSAKVSRAKALARNGYTQSEIADALGVSTSTIQEALS